METWKLPDKIKVLEALGAIIDGRVKINRENKTAICLSSDRKKEYTIKYDVLRSAIISNDNSAHWQGKLGYPAIAVLMELGELSKDQIIAEAVADIPWKEINTRFSNDNNKTLAVVHEIAKGKGVKEKDLDHYMDKVMEEIEEKSYRKLTD